MQKQIQLNQYRLGRDKVAKMMFLELNLEMIRGTQKFSKHDFYCSLLNTNGLINQYGWNMRSYIDNLLGNEDAFDEEYEGLEQNPHHNISAYHFSRSNLEKHAWKRLGKDSEKNDDDSVGERDQSDEGSSSESDDEEIDDDRDSNISQEDIEEIYGEGNRAEADLDVLSLIDIMFSYGYSFYTRNSIIFLQKYTRQHKSCRRSKRTSMVTLKRYNFHFLEERKYRIEMYMRIFILVGDISNTLFYWALHSRVIAVQTIFITRCPMVQY